MDIVIVTCVYKRPQILKVFLENYLYLQEQVEKSGNTLSLIMAGDKYADVDCYTLYKEVSSEVIWLNTPNSPLSNKWNTALNYAKKIPHSHVLILGSDDLLSLQTLEIYLAKGNDHDFIGISDMYILNSATGDFMFWPGYKLDRKGESLGAGRLIRKDILEQLGYKIWESNLSKTLDASMTRTIKDCVKTPLVLSCEKDGVFLMDIKSEVNIWSYEVYRSNHYRPAELSVVFSDNMPFSIFQSISQLIPRSSSAVAIGSSVS